MKEPAQISTLQLELLGLSSGKDEEATSTSRVKSSALFSSDVLDAHVDDFQQYGLLGSTIRFKGVFEHQHSIFSFYLWGTGEWEVAYNCMYDR